jgi:2-polyprenyl-3-methyl-5-hydroxy-6-metoxy-1,4-benzoquinol methylase
MKESNNKFNKALYIYQTEGWGGIKRRILMRINLIKQLGIKGIYERFKGKLSELKEGRYSLKYAYPQRFFEDNLEDSRPMAEYLAPRIIKALNIKSVIDLGCATGHWVDAIDRTGAKVLGVEGGERAKSMLVCDPKKVIFADLRDPLPLEGNYELVLSLEVAEHIEHKFVDKYLENIDRFNPKLIMMTAATPGQGGEFHVNEQNEDYWNSQFHQLGYKRIPKVEQLVARMVEDAKNLENPPTAMRNPLSPHGVHIPFWMPKNLLVFSKNPSIFNNL